ncbi:glutathione S-transferase N-terminal domain-containing protein [Candidatus Woesearchaeota archaeon]|nr:glutathione S-transferase N-terminal domain-containing protein [Candidatus Woesearchaeota archaeon]
MAVKIYTTPTCPWCKKTKEFLKENNIEYEEINVVGNQEAQKEMIDKSGQMGVPVLDIDGTIIVGYDVERIKQALEI